MHVGSGTKGTAWQGGNPQCCGGGRAEVCHTDVGGGKGRGLPGAEELGWPGSTSVAPQAHHHPVPVCPTGTPPCSTCVPPRDLPQEDTDRWRRHAVPIWRAPPCSTCVPRLTCQRKTKIDGSRIDRWRRAPHSAASWGASAARLAAPLPVGLDPGVVTTRSSGIAAAARVTRAATPEVSQKTGRGPYASTCAAGGGGDPMSAHCASSSPAPPHPHPTP